MPERLATAVDLTPLHQAMTAAITRTAPGLNPRLAAAIAMTATETAVQHLGTDRCVHDAGIHHRHHTHPVPGCPWCSDTGVADQPDTIKTGDAL